MRIDSLQSLVMPIIDPRDGFVYLYLTLMIDQSSKMAATMIGSTLNKIPNATGDILDIS